MGRQNLRCHIRSTLRFCSRHHFQVTADPLCPMIWGHSTSIYHLQYGRVLREWPVISFRPSLHLSLDLPFPWVSLKGIWMTIFSNLSPDLLQTWPKYLNFCWSILVLSDDYLPMRDCMCSLVMWSLHDIPGGFLPQHISKAVTLLSFCFSACSDSPCLTSIGRNWKYQRLYDTYLCCAGDVSIFPDIGNCLFDNNLAASGPWHVEKGGWGPQVDILSLRVIFWPNPHLFKDLLQTHF